MNTPIKMSTVILILMLSFVALANEEITTQTLGQELHENKCQSCHTTTTYTREDHTIKSHKALENRVKACMKPAKAEWDQTEQKAVIEYLNKHFYKF